MSRHILQIVTTGKQSLDEVMGHLKQCSSEMVDCIQIREKHRTARELLSWVEACYSLLPNTSVIINDRLDVAMSMQTAGVQLAYHSLPPTRARKLLPEDIQMGCSVHSVEEAQQACASGADYVIYGHIYSSSSKPNLQPRGIDLLCQIVESVDIPVIAIGGIQPEHVEEVLSTRCSGIAVMSSIFHHPNPGQQVAQFRYHLDQSQYKPRYPLQGFKKLGGAL